MPNHFHLLIQNRSEKNMRELAQKSYKDFDMHKFLMQKLSCFLNSYAKAFDSQNSRNGAFFLDYTKTIEIKKEVYFTGLINYILQHPVCYQFCKSLSDWRYSTYNSLIFKWIKRQSWSEMQFLTWFNGIEKFIHFHQDKILITQTYKVFEIF